MSGVTFRFCPRDGRAYESSVPLYLGGDMSKPYLTLEVKLVLRPTNMPACLIPYCVHRQLALTSLPCKAVCLLDYLA